MKKLIISSMLMALSGLVYAGQADITLQANSTINASCTMSIPDIVYPNVSMKTMEMLNMQGAVSSYCTKGTSYIISFDPGTSGTYTERSMKSDNISNTDKLIYNLYIGKTPGTKFGDGTNGTVTSSTLIGNGSDVIIQTFNLKISPKQFPQPDIYKDVISVKITY